MYSVVARKMFFLMLCGCSRQNTLHKSQLKEVNGDLHKVFFFGFCQNYNFNYKFKTNELKSVEKLVEQTIQALKSC